VELLAVRRQRLGQGGLVHEQVLELLAQLRHVVEGDQDNLPDVATRLVPHILGDVELLAGLALARAIRQAIEQVPAQQDFGRRDLGAARDALEIAALVALEAEIQAWMVGSLPGIGERLRRTHSFDRAEDGGVGLLGTCQGRIGVRRQVERHVRRQGRHVGRQAPDDALEARRGVVQVGGFDQQIGLGKGQAAGDLLEVHGAGDLGLDALVGLRIHGAMLHEVVFGQPNQLPEPGNVDIGPRRLQGDVLGSLDQLEQARARRVVEPAHLADGAETVIQQLCQAQGPIRAAVLVGDGGTALGANCRRQVDARKQATARCVAFGFGTAHGVPARKHFRVLQDGLLRRLAQGHRHGRRARRRECARACVGRGRSGLCLRHPFGGEQRRSDQDRCPPGFLALTPSLPGSQALVRLHCHVVVRLRRA
jgi:hypothetical protein